MARKSTSVFSILNQEALEKFVSDRGYEPGRSPEELDTNKKDRLVKLLSRIPKREKDMLFLRCIMGKNQTQIARMYGVSQVAISYRLTRALQRIELFKMLIDIEKDDFYGVLERVFRLTEPEIRLTEEKLDFSIEVMWLILQTSNQSETGRLLGRSQYCIRSRFFRGLKAIHRVRYILREELREDGDTDEEFYKVLTYYAKVFRKIRKNWHILLEKNHKWKRPDVVI